VATNLTDEADNHLIELLLATLKSLLPITLKTLSRQNSFFPVLILKPDEIINLREE